MSNMIKYITAHSLTDSSLSAAIDSTNWAIDEALIKEIRVITAAIDWDLTIYCDSDQTSGMFSSIKIGKNLSGNQDILLDIPYIDNDSNNSVHCLFADNVASNGAVIDIYGEEARIT